MHWRPTWRQALSSLFAPWIWLAGVAAFAAPTAADRFSVDMGVGHESQTSPLFQLTPNSTVVYLGGPQRLGGSHLQAHVQGFYGFSLEDGLSASLAGNAMLKRSPQTPDLDFSFLSLQPTLHLPLKNFNIDFGLNLQRIDVAGQRFRDIHGVQANWTRFDGKNLWAMVGETGSYRHKGELTDLDAQASSLVLQRHLSQPLKGVDGLDLSLIVGRERNERGFRDLSHRSAMFNASLQWAWLGASWSAGAGWRRAQFDDKAFPSEPERIDRGKNIDLMAEWPLSSRQALSVQVNDIRNTSSTRLYNNHYRQLGVTLHTSW